jgi:hypothetical protein
MAQGPTVEFGDVFVVRETVSGKRRRPLWDGVRLDSLPCRVAQLPGSRFCLSHDPTTTREPSVNGLRVNYAVSD